jgi:hypothetical protein
MLPQAPHLMLSEVPGFLMKNVSSFTVAIRIHPFLSKQVRIYLEAGKADASSQEAMLEGTSEV